MVRRTANAVLAAAIVAGIAGLGYWAGVNAVAPPEIAAETHSRQTYAVENGTVARSIDVPVTALWSTARTLFAGTDGTVTSIVHQAGELAESGDVLATINLEPVVVAPGQVPMFRRLQKGTRGPDVAQFQALLRTKGFLRGPADGRFGLKTVAAAKRWQKSVGATQDAILDPGALVFVGSLPARIEVTATIGERVSTVDELVRVLEAKPAFVATVSGSQRGELTSGSSITIKAPGGGTWRGTVGSFVQLADGRFQAALTGELCGSACDVVPVNGETTLSASIELVPETSGPVVPTSALIQQPSGDLAVTLADGTVRSVQVKAEADGFAVVEGIKPGTVIQLPSPSP